MSTFETYNTMTAEQRKYFDAGHRQGCLDTEKHGSWREDKTSPLPAWMKPSVCSWCGEKTMFPEKYCPHCGAKMGET